MRPVIERRLRAEYNAEEPSQILAAVHVAKKDRWELIGKAAVPNGTAEIEIICRTHYHGLFRKGSNLFDHTVGEA